MEKWIRCNACFRLQKSSHDFHLTQCQHIFCSRCVSAVQKQCPMCKAVGVGTMEIHRPLQPALQPYFAALPPLVQRMLDIAHMREVQTSIVMDRFRQIQRKYEILKKNYVKMTDKRRSLYVEYERLKVDMMKRCRHLAGLESALKSRTLVQNRSLQWDDRSPVSHDPRENSSNYLRPRYGTDTSRGYEDAARIETPKAKNFRDRHSAETQFFSPLSPYQYQPRTILARGSSHLVTPNNKGIPLRIPRSIDETSSSDGGFGTPNFYNR